MNRNAYGIIRYFQEVLGSSSGELVVVDRAKLKVVVGLAKQSGRYSRAKANAQYLRQPTTSS